MIVFGLKVGPLWRCFGFVISLVVMSEEGCCGEREVGSSHGASALRWNMHGGVKVGEKKRS